MTRGVFHRQGPFVGSGGLYGPGPAIAARFRDRATAERRSHVILGLGRSCTVHCGTARRFGHPFARCIRWLSLSRATVLPGLGPRSLLPPLF